MFSKIVYFYRRLSFMDFLRKVLSFSISFISRATSSRKIKAWFVFKNWDLTLGNNLRIYGLPFNIKVGDKCSFYDNCVFEFGNGCQVQIGSNVVFSYGVIFSCRTHISLGNDVQVGEYSSIRDSTHRYDQGFRPMKYATDKSEPVVIGNDVWIGRGCLIMPGSIIEEGVVVAAHSVVKGRLFKDGIYGGKPATFIKSRLSENA